MDAEIRASMVNRRQEIPDDLQRVVTLIREQRRVLAVVADAVRANTQAIERLRLQMHQQFDAVDLALVEVRRELRTLRIPGRP
jgi:hypothetical protein